MGNLDLLMHGFGIAFSLNHLGLMLIGVLMGLVVGVLPGLGAPNGVSLLLPLTFGMPPVWIVQRVFSEGSTRSAWPSVVRAARSSTLPA